MNERVYKEQGGIRRTVIIDPDKPHEFTVKTEQRVDEILEGVARDRELLNRRGPNKVLARIPITIYERSIHENWDEGDWKKWLNSDEARPFRIWGGRV